MHGLLNINSQNNKYYKMMADCPLCGLATETINHVFSYSHPDANSFHVKQQEILWKQLGSNTPTLVLHHLQQGGQGYIDGLARPSDMSIESTSTISSRSSSPLARPEPALESVLSASAQQSELGWEQLVRGRLSALWGDAIIQTLLAQQQ
jgi:hypothetical protein